MLSQNDFQSEESFTLSFTRILLRENSFCEAIQTQEIQDQFIEIVQTKGVSLSTLFLNLSEWCKYSPRPIVLVIDEVDSASNNQVFLDFLAQLRGYYQQREKFSTFHSVILSGVYDIKNLKLKIDSDQIKKLNSPWNIAAKFDIDMSFSPSEILQMLLEYEKDYHTNANMEEVAQLIFDYTSGYPFLVSSICRLLDEIVSSLDHFPTTQSVWSKNGVIQAVKLLLDEKNTLFESLINKLYDFEDLHQLIYTLLFSGKSIAYNSRNKAIEIAEMFGFIKKQNGTAVISNRIFETLLYDQFLSDELIKNLTYSAALKDKNQFIQDGHLNMELVLEKFVQTFTDLYSDTNNAFIEDIGRKYFLLFLKPIINGVGNYYIEAQTRNMRRTDVIIDYLGEQFIVEMKIWHGEEYNKRGEQQLLDYLDYYHLEKGYMLSFNFNKTKVIGIKHVEINNRVIIEAVV